MIQEKPINQACIRNQQPISEAMAGILKQSNSVLEIGCGTGQHAVYMAQSFTHLHWWPTDIESALPLFTVWFEEYEGSNIEVPSILDVNQLDHWPKRRFDCVFSANTLHYICGDSCQNLFDCAAHALNKGGHLAIYGPINEEGYTSEGNKSLDQWLKESINPNAGIKEWLLIRNWANNAGLQPTQKKQLPANNWLMLFRKT